MSLPAFDTVDSFRQFRQGLSGSVGLVPTMGFLHAGHLSLIEAAQAENDHVVVSIFVNPTQFAQGEDLDSYPRDLPRDLALLESAGVSGVFMPTPDQMYPAGFQTYVTVEHLTAGLEGAQRPTHFRGVTTVVSKLFNIVQADRAYFGQKDAQQVVVIRRMVADLNLPVKIEVCPILREDDGLAMSSRNVYLSETDRKRALAINQALKSAGELYANGERNPDQFRNIIRKQLKQQARIEPDYVSVADARTLVECINATSAPLLVSVAAQVGKPRLLDNCLLPIELNTRVGVTATLGAI